MRLSLGAQHELSVCLPNGFYAQSSVREGSRRFRTGRAGDDAPRGLDLDRLVRKRNRRRVGRCSPHRVEAGRAEQTAAGEIIVPSLVEALLVEDQIAFLVDDRSRVASSLLDLAS